MSTVVREAGFEIRIYLRDHPPPHVHVAKAGAIVKILLGTFETFEILGNIGDHDVRRAERLVQKHSATLRAAWMRMHGERTTDRKRS